MRDLLISIAWAIGAVGVISLGSWLLVRRYPDALDRIPAPSESDELGAASPAPPIAAHRDAA